MGVEPMSDEELAEVKEYLRNQSDRSDLDSIITKLGAKRRLLARLDAAEREARRFHAIMDKVFRARELVAILLIEEPQDKSAVEEADDDLSVLITMALQYSPAATKAAEEAMAGVPENGATR